MLNLYPHCNLVPLYKPDGVLLPRTSFKSVEKIQAYGLEFRI